MVSDEEYALEITGSDASAQNAIVESPNKTFGQMMRCLLYSSDLGPEYWSWALQHAVYIKNCILHRSLKTTPYEKFTGTKPDLSNLKIFGSKIYARKPGCRKFKLDNNTANGIFLGYTATDKNVIYIDSITGKVKIATHVIFDKAHMTVPASKSPIAAQTLQRLGYYAKEDWITEQQTVNDNSNLLVQKLSDTATMPKQATNNSIGYDMYANSKDKIIIPAGQIIPIPTGIAIQCPHGMYACITPRSGLCLKRNLTLEGGVIDPDYRGDVTILLRNFGKIDVIIQPNERIAQLILESAVMAETTEVDNLNNTDRGSKGFGSTGTTTPIKDGHLIFLRESTGLHWANFLKDNFRLSNVRLFS
jgi:dUTP pyrophosphatase